MILIAIHVVPVCSGCSGYEEGKRDAPKPVVEQSQETRAQMRDFGFLTRRPPLLKKGKSGQSLG